MKKLLSILMILTLCTAGMALAEAPAEENEYLAWELDEEQSVLTVTLVANATTGYAWTWAMANEDMIHETSEDYILDEAEEGVVGAGGHTVYIFETTMTGEAGMETMTFTYAQPWDAENPGVILEMDVWVDEAGLMRVEEVRQILPEVEAEAAGA